MVSLFSDIRKLVSGVGQFSSAIRGNAKPIDNNNHRNIEIENEQYNTNNNNNSASIEPSEEEELANYRKSKHVNTTDNNINNIPKSPTPTIISKDENNNNNQTTMSKALEKHFPNVYKKKNEDGGNNKNQLYLSKKTSSSSSHSIKRRNSNNNSSTSSTVSFAPSATSSWSSVGSNSSKTTSTRATVLGLNDAVVELDDYEYAGVVGRGHSSTVILLQHKVTGVHYALKIIKRKTPRSWYIESFEKELHASLDHPFICPLLHSFVTYEERCYVLPFAAGGSLRNCMRNYHDTQIDEDDDDIIYRVRSRNDVRGQMPHKLARFYITEIVSALKYLHDKKVVYHDLKPENVLIDETGHLLLCDFGLSMSNVGQLTGAGRSFRGTPKYVAPEVILRRDHGTVIDSWSLGIMIYEMYFGHVPFRGTSRRDLYQRICGANLRFPKLKKMYEEEDNNNNNNGNYTKNVESGKRRVRRSVSDLITQQRQSQQKEHGDQDFYDSFDYDDDNNNNDKTMRMSTNNRKKSKEKKKGNKIEEDAAYYLPIIKDMIIRLLRRNPVNRLTVESLMEHEYFENINWEDVYNGIVDPPKKKNDD